MMTVSRDRGDMSNDECLNIKCGRGDMSNGDCLKRPWRYVKGLLSQQTVAICRMMTVSRYRSDMSNDDCFKIKCDRGDMSNDD